MTPVSIELSRQNTYLYRKNRVVVKSMDIRAAYEERMFEQIFSFYQTSSIIPASRHFSRFSINHLSEKLDIPHPLFRTERCYTLFNLKNFLFIRKELFDLVDSRLQSVATQYPEQNNSHISQPFFFLKAKNDFYEKKLQQCEKLICIYPQDKEEIEIDFKLLALLLKINESESVRIKFKNIEKSHLTEAEILETINNTDWNLCLPDMHAYFKDEQICKPLVNCEIKNYIPNMICLDKIDTYPKVFSKIFSNLSQKSHLSALLAGVYQTMDLHVRNIGVVNDLPKHLHHFRKMRFQVQTDDKSLEEKHPFLSFENLQFNYLYGKIDADNAVMYSDGNQSKIKTIATIPYLKESLECNWKFCLFDGNYFVGESNDFYIINDGKYSGTYLPLKIALINTPYRKQILSYELIEEVTKDTSSIDQWIQRMNAPIRRRLSLSSQESVRPFIESLLQLPEFNLSFNYTRDSYTSMASIQRTFAFELANGETKEHKNFWKIITCDLRRVRALKNDNYETLTKRYQVNIEHLLISNHYRRVEKGQIVRLPSLLLNKSPLECFKWRVKIASQFFPRLTFKQQAALNSRRNSLNNYIDLYKKLESFEKNTETYMELVESLMEVSICYESKKDLIINHLKCLLEKTSSWNEKIEKFHTKLLHALKPTYLNVIKSMYPFLADTLRLVHILNSIDDEKYFYNQPLELLIERAQELCPNESEGFRIRQRLLEKIISIENPYVFF